MSDKYGIDEKTRFLVLLLDAQLPSSVIAKIIRRPEWTVSRWELRTRRGEDIRIRKKGSGLRKPKSEVVPVDKEKLLQIEFCKQMLCDGGKLIFHTFFSGETKIELTNSPSKVWNVPIETIRKNVVPETIKLNCWGAISARGATSLQISERSMSSELFRKAIENHKKEMEKLYPDGEFYFLQEKIPLNKVNEEWLVNEQNLNLVKLPKQTSELNVIDSLWATLKERVSGDVLPNEKELKSKLLSNWEQLTKPERLKTLFEGLYRRYMDFIAKES